MATEGLDHHLKADFREINLGIGRVHRRRPQKQAKKSIPRSKGTAFALSHNLMVTAKHVVCEGQEARPDLQVRLASGGLLDFDVCLVAGELALLRLHGRLHDSVTLFELVNHDIVPGAPWYSYGYPAASAKERLDWIGGYVGSPYLLTGDGPQAFLYCQPLGAAQPKDLHGFSGAPVILWSSGTRFLPCIGAVVKSPAAPSDNATAEGGAVLAYSFERLEIRQTEDGHEIVGFVGGPVPPLPPKRTSESQVVEYRRVIARARRRSLGPLPRIRGSE